LFGKIDLAVALDNIAVVMCLIGKIIACIDGALCVV
jgi:hypothetical protein